ncbi:MAG: hypothetical protein WBQ53_08385, partial [Methylocystis sp.]
MRRALFGSVEFIAAYQAAMVAKPPPVGAARTIAGSVNAVIVSYYQSAEFKGSRASAARVYRNILERFREAHGDKSAVGMRTKHVRKLMAEKAATPDAANRMLGMISILMEQAIALGLRDDNPCVGVKKLKHKGGGFATWNEDQIAAYRAHHPLESFRLRLKHILSFRGMRRIRLRGRGQARSRWFSKRPLAFAA